MFQIELTISPEEMGATLAGLRLYQRYIESGDNDPNIEMIATDCDSFEQLDSHEIEQLIYKYNFS